MLPEQSTRAETGDLAGYLCRCSSAAARRRGTALAWQVLAAPPTGDELDDEIRRDATEALAAAQTEASAARWRLLDGLRTIAGGAALFVLGVSLLALAWDAAWHRTGGWLELVAQTPEDRVGSFADGEADRDESTGPARVRRYSFAVAPETEQNAAGDQPPPPTTSARPSAQPPPAPLPEPIPVEPVAPLPERPADPMASVASRILSTEAFSSTPRESGDGTGGPPAKKWVPVDLNDFVAPPKAQVRTGPRTVVGGGSAEKEALRTLRTGRDDASLVFRAPNRREDRKGLPDDEPQTQLPELWVGETEVTQRQYMAVMGMDLGAISGQWWQPAEAMSWCDAIEFANRLSDKEGLEPAYVVEGDCEHGGTVRWNPAAVGFRLPTENEWEKLVSNAGQDARAVPGGANDRGIAPVHADLEDGVEGLVGLTDNAAEWVWGRGPGADPTLHRPGATRTIARACLEGAAEQVANYTVEALPCRLVAATDDHRLGVGFRLVRPRAGKG